MVDYANNPKASTGKFECIYQQPISPPRYGPSLDLVVRGFALPLQYFYDGYLPENDEIHDITNINEENDIKKVLYKIKQFHDTQAAIRNGDCLRHSGKISSSDNVDRLTNHSDLRSSSSTSAVEDDTYPKLRKIPLPIQDVQSVTDIRSLIKKSNNSFMSFRSNERPFIFSKLDDGSHGKGSFIKVDLFTEIQN